MAGAVTSAGTATFLAGMYGLLQPYQTQSRAHAGESGPAWELERRYRTHLLLEDLARLGYAGVPPLHTWPNCCERCRCWKVRHWADR